MRHRTSLARAGTGLFAALLAASLAAPTAALGDALPTGADPFTAPALAQFLGGRSGSVTAALFNVHTGALFLYRPGVTEETASIVKVDILETLLDQRQATGRPLSSAEQDQATDMITESDNDDATTLWNDDGGAPGVADYDREAGLADTVPNLDWGFTTTTAADQVRLLRELVSSPSPLDEASRSLELGLMESVDPSQAWGISAGVPAGATLALKNGWLPLGSGDWQVNSIGYVADKGTGYLLAVLTTGDPDEQYGIATIEDTARLVWGDVQLASGAVAAAPPPAVGASARPRAIPSGGAVVHLRVRSRAATRCEVTASPRLAGLARSFDCASGARVLALAVAPNPRAVGRRIELVVTATGSDGRSASTTVVLHENAHRSLG